MYRLLAIMVLPLVLSACLDEADIKFRSDRIEVNVVDDSSGRAEALLGWALTQEFNPTEHPLLGSRRPVIFNRNGIVPTECTVDRNCTTSAPAGREYLDCLPVVKRGENEATEFRYDGTRIDADELSEMLHLYECNGVEYPARVVDVGAGAGSQQGYGFFTIQSNNSMTPLFVVQDDPDAFVYPWGALYLYYHRGLNERCPEVDPRLWHPKGVELCPDD